MEKTVKRRRFLVLTVVVLFIAAGMFCLSRYNALLQGLKKNPALSFSDIVVNDSGERFPLDQAQYLALGWLNNPRSLFMPPSLKRSLQKRPHSIRIGMFGPSFLTCGGRKAGNSYTYPSLLENKLREYGLKNIEVINFGVSGYGLFQQYFLWQFIGRSYNLDYVVLTIRRDCATRDLTFCGGSDFGPLHARYILPDNALKLVPVSGSTREEACRIYHRILPPLRYLRYDRGMPLGLKALLPERLHSRANPFYYKLFTSVTDEVNPIYAAILKDIASKVKHVIVLVDEEDAASLRKLVGSSNVSYFSPQASRQLDTFLYYEVDGKHPNVWANRLVADELFSYLTGKKSWRTAYIKLSPSFGTAKNEKPCSAAPIFMYDKLSFKTGEFPVSDIVDDKAELLSRSFPRSPAWKGQDIRSFVLLPFQSVRDFVPFFPFPVSLKKDDAVFISFSAGGKVIKVPIGLIRAPAQSLGQIELTSKKIKLSYKCDFGKKTFDLRLEIWDNEILNKISPNTKDFDILIGDQMIFKTKPEKRDIGDLVRGIFIPKSPAALSRNLEENTFEKVYLRSNNEYYFDTNPFKEEAGTIDFVLERKDGPEERCPVFSYEFIPFERVIQEPYQALMDQYRSLNPVGDKELGSLVEEMGSGR